MTSSRLPVGPITAAGGEPLKELASILAAGLQRLRARKSSELSGADGESSLDFVANQSGVEPESTAIEMPRVR